MKVKYLINILVIVLLLLVISCNETINDNPLENQPPETHLFIYADSTLSQQKSKLQVHWWGDDQDGLVVGYLFKWEGINNSWTFTKSNDSIFALPIGTVDTSFNFVISAIDNSGNGKYDNEVLVNGINFGAEPFQDKNNNGIFDEGEPYFDYGAIDPTPAIQKFPIKNSSPKIEWNDLTVLPEITFPAITVGWNATDLDGDETITEIHIALNDTTNFIKLNGSTRLVSLIIENLNSENAAMNIFINADGDKKFSENLPNLILNGNNKLFIKAIDNSGAASKFVSLPSDDKSWFVKKPKGDLLLVDDYPAGIAVTDFYKQKFDDFYLNQYDIFNIETTSLPYESITYLNTLKLIKKIFWFSGSSPRLDLSNLITQKFLQGGGKIAYSMTFQDSSANLDFSIQTLQAFLPIESFDSKKPLSFLFGGANLVSTNEFSNFSDLSTQSTIGFVRTFKTSNITSKKVYDLTSQQLNGEIALMNNTKTLFFIGLPLHQCDANGNVGNVLQEIFINQFGLN